MKRILLRVLLMTIAFACGLGIHDLVSSFQAVPARMDRTETVTPTVVEAQPEPIVQALPLPTPPPNLILDYDAKKFLPDGGYYVLGSMPKEFREFSSLEVYSGTHDDPPVGYVGVSTHSHDRYDSQPAVFALVTERRLFFVTSSANGDGYEYRFDGEFLRRDIGSVADKKISVLRGKLTKTKKGRKIAEALVNFRFEYVGC